MWQAFVPANHGDEYGGNGRGLASKKRPRAVASGDGETASAFYERIIRVQPGKASSHGNGSSSSTTNGSGRTSGRSSRVEGAAGYRPGTGAPPLLPPSPPPPLPTGAGRLSREAEGGNPLALTVFGPALNPNRAHESENGVEQQPQEEEEEEEGFFCRVCGERVKSVSEDKHNSTTLHIFNQQHRPQERKVQLHESNKGFQLLAGMGWKLDEGLGARKQGRVNPLQTTFKRGTTGLGAGEKLRPRVTHFPSHVPSQALNAPDGKSDAVRAHESLDRRRGSSNANGKSGRSGASGVVSGVARPFAAAAAESSRSSWGGFWGQETTPPGSNSGSSGAPSSGVVRSSDSRKGRGVGGVSRGGGRGGDNGKEGAGSSMSRKEREAHIARETRKERRARFELFSDIPEEYAALFTS